MKNNLVQFAFIVLALVVGGALEDMLPTVGALGAPVLLSLAVFFAAIAVAVRFVREPVLWIAVSYPSYQIWLALVSDGAGALARVLLSIPVGAACMAAALAVLPRLWRKAGADA